MGPDSPWRDWRHTAATTTVVLTVALLFLAGLTVVRALSTVIAYLVAALFFAVVLTPAVDALEHRAHMRRGLATGLVFVAGLATLSALLYVFIRPIVDQGQKFADNLPELVRKAERGEGTVGELVKKYDLEKKVKENSSQIQKAAQNLGTPALGVVKSVFAGLIALITVAVLTFLMLLQGPNLSAGFLSILPDTPRERVRRVASDAATAVSGYMLGNFLISLVAGITAYIYLRIMGVPYAEVLALWVAFADLIPLVGATLGAVPTIGFAFLHSTAAGIVGIIFFIVYQQFENNVLQVSVMSRTVQVNPLGVLVSVMIGVTLFGLLGALIAIPGAGVVQVVVRDVWDNRTRGFKDPPTVGEDEVPITTPEG